MTKAIKKMESIKSKLFILQEPKSDSLSITGTKIN